MVKKQLHNLWDVWCKWREMKRVMRNMRIFDKLLKDGKTGMESMVQSVAEKRANAIIMNWLDSKRILHCRYCPSTDRLRNHMDYKLCEWHFENVAAHPSANGKAALSPTQKTGG